MSVENLAKVKRRLNFEDAVIETRSDVTATKLVTIADFSKMDREQKMNAMEKWNFDFENEVPLEGDWEWKKVDAPLPQLDAKDKVSLHQEKDKSNRDI